MFADPQSVTVNAVAQSLPAISREGLKSQYQKVTGEYTLTISHDVNKKTERHLIRLDHRKTVSDPLTPANNVDVISSVYIVIANPVTGFSDTELRNDALGLAAWATSGNLDKVLGLES